MQNKWTTPQSECSVLPAAPALIALTGTSAIVTRLFNVRRTLFQSILHPQLIASWQNREPLPFLWLMNVGRKLIRSPIEQQTFSGYLVYDNHHGKAIISKG